MNYMIKFDGAGNLTEVRPQSSPGVVLEGYTLVEAPENLDGLKYYWNGFELVPYSQTGAMLRRAPPGPGLRWVPVEERWVDDRPEEVQIEETWKRVRAERDKLLAESDWRVTKAVETGVPLSAEWQAYRQALRDITTVENPSLVVWPTPPA